MCILNEKGKELLREQLTEFQQQAAKKTSNMISSFPLQCIQEIIDNANHFFNEETLLLNTSLMDNEHYTQIIEIVNSILSNSENLCEEKNEPTIEESTHSESDRDDDSAGDDSTDDDSKYHPRIVSSDSEYSD